MQNQFKPKELREIQKEILKGISLKDQFTEIKLIAAFDITFTKNKYACSSLVFEYPSLKLIEKKNSTGEELMPYSPNFSAFREGPQIIELFKQLENKPDILITNSHGALHPNKVGLASYIGVLLNKPTIGVFKNLIFGRLDQDNILFDQDLKGKALKTKEHAKPVFITPGHGISIESSYKIIKNTIRDHKMPLPIHLAHKYANKLKKQLKVSSVPQNQDH